MHEPILGEKDLFHSMIVLIEQKKEEILQAWLESEHIDEITVLTGEPPSEIGRDFLSAVISQNGARAAEEFRASGSDVLARSFQGMKRVAGRVLEPFADKEVVYQLFDEVLILLLSAHCVSTQNLTKEYQRAVDASAIVSNTDRRGIITYTNEMFRKVSGYGRDELLGKPHNVIRHPDMPKEVFADLWATIKAKKIWHGIIKNRKKDGGHYWVDTTITPILEVNGEIREYISIRWQISDPSQIFPLVCRNPN